MIAGDCVLHTEDAWEGVGSHCTRNAIRVLPQGDFDRGFFIRLCHEEEDWDGVRVSFYLQESTTKKDWVWINSHYITQNVDPGWKRDSTSIDGKCMVMGSRGYQEIIIL